jgi:peptide methionine sulfoxide reductase msrA/msrB
MGGLEGVYRTKVGYCGGTTEKPTYRSIGDHTESLLVEYCPATTSYRDLLRAFFKYHQPNKTRLLKQYESIIFPSNGEEYEQALEIKGEFERKQKFKCATTIQMSCPSKFTTAEEYHQKYYLRQNLDIMDYLQDKLSLDPNSEAFTFGMLSTKLNAYMVTEDRSSMKATIRLMSNESSMDSGHISALLDMLED